MVYRCMNSVNKQYKNQDQIYYHFQHLSFHMHFVYIPFMINQLLFCFSKAFNQQLFIFPHIIKQQLDISPKIHKKSFQYYHSKCLLELLLSSPQKQLSHQSSRLVYVSRAFHCIFTLGTFTFNNFMNLYPDLLNIHFIKGGLFQKHFSLPLKHEKLRS